MSDEEVAFDDWQAEAEAVVEQVKNQPPPEPETQEPVSEQAEEPKKKVEVVDPRQALITRIAHYNSLTSDSFDDYLEESKANSSNTVVKGSTQILKNDKDFAQFARSVGKRLNQQAAEVEADVLEESNLFVFVDELLLLLYGQTEWKNMEGVKEKLRIVKKERKDQEIKAKKQQEREQRLKKQQKATEQEESTGSKKEIKVEQPQEDIFDGATFINSKQIDDERKNKEKVKVEAPPKPADEDDDDFM